MIPPRISKNGRLPCRIESTKTFAIRNLEYYYADITEDGYISFGQHKPDTGVCATTIDKKLLGYKTYLKNAIDFLEEMSLYDKVFYNTIINFYKEKFDEDLKILLGAFINDY